MKLFTKCALAVVCSLSAHAQEKTTRSLIPEMEAAMKNYSQTGSLYSSIPKLRAEGRNGYIILTENYVRDNSKELKNFIKHKEQLGFTVTVATEDDFGTAGEGHGRRQAYKVREWLQENWEQKKLLYALIISNPHPEKGKIPMAKFGALDKNKLDDRKKEKFLSENTEFTPEGYAKWNGAAPTDFYYTDLTSNFDPNNNTVLNDKEDQKVEGAIDAVSDIYVGRIPYFGEDHEYSKVSDVDAMLRRTIDYENEKGDLSYRAGVMISGGTEFKRFLRLRNDFLAYNGAYYEMFGKPDIVGPLPKVQVYSAYNISEYLKEDHPIGSVIFSGHGSPVGMDGITTKYAVDIQREKPLYIYLGGCDVGSPEHDNNVANAIFRHIGIGTVAGTRSVTSVAGDRDTFMAAGYPRLFAGQSLGEMHWRGLSDYQDERARISGTNILMNLYGDPSVVVVPQDNTKPVILSPNLEPIRLSGSIADSNSGSLDYFLTNGSDKPQEYSIRLDKNLKSSANNFKLAPKASRKLTIGFKNVSSLGLGKHDAAFAVTAGGHTETRKIQLELASKNPILNLNFDNLADRKKIKVTPPKPSKDSKPPKFDYTKESKFYDIPAKHKAEYIKPEKASFAIGNRDLSLAFTFKLSNPSAKNVPIVDFGKFFGEDVTTKYRVLSAFYQDKKLKISGSYVSNSEETVALELEAPVDASEWNQVILSTDRANDKVYLYVNGKKYEEKLELTLNHGMLIKTLHFGSSRAGSDLHLQNFLLADYQLDRNALRLFHYGKTIQRVSPINAEKVNNASVNLQWNTKQDGGEFLVYLADNPRFQNAKTQKTTDHAFEFTGLKDKTQYYWKVVPELNGKSIPEDKLQLSSFITDSSIKGHEVLVNKARLKKPLQANVKENLFTFDFNKIVRSFEEVNGKRTKVPLFFSMLEGEGWLEMRPDGNLFTPFGAPKAGTYKFKASATAPNTKPVTFEFIVIAK